MTGSAVDGVQTAHFIACFLFLSCFTLNSSFSQVPSTERCVTWSARCKPTTSRWRERWWNTRSDWEKHSLSSTRWVKRGKGETHQQKLNCTFWPIGLVEQNTTAHQTETFTCYLFRSAPQRAMPSSNLSQAQRWTWRMRQPLLRPQLSLGTLWSRRSLTTAPPHPAAQVSNICEMFVHFELEIWTTEEQCS